MATKKPSSPKKPAESAPRVTRIRTASTAASDKKAAPAATSTPDLAAPKKRVRISAIGRPFVRIGGYFKGSWQELRQVRWPNRRTTWSMTGALIAFTAFFVVLILLLDALFKYLFELILK